MPSKSKEGFIYMKNTPKEITISGVSSKEKDDGSNELFYSLLDNQWFTKKGSKKFEYNGPIPFEVTIEDVVSSQRERKAEDLPPGSYFIARSGGWINRNFTDAPSSHAQKLNSLLLDRIKEAYKEIERDYGRNSLEFTPSDLLHLIVYPNSCQ